MSAAPASAIVFAYHTVGVRCLKVLLDGGIDVRLIVTHLDDPQENVWFQSVAEVTADHGIACITPDDANAADTVARCTAAEPDFLFSFYYRQMLKPALLELPRRGAYNMHGSLLPKYRGRAPVNWAVLHGERETGATLHAMQVKPDSGAIVAQSAVPILADDTAWDVFGKVAVAAEIALARVLPALVAGAAPAVPQDLSKGSYFGGRNPEDGRIPATATAKQIHDLVRAVAPPYPGAFIDIEGARVLIERTLRVDNAPAHPAPTLSMQVRGGTLWLDAADGHSLRVLAASIDGEPLTATAFSARFGAAGVTPA